MTESPALVNSARTWTTVLTIFFAFVSALSTMMMSRSFNRNLLAKSEAAILESRIADQWAYYQSKNVRRDILHLAQVLTKNKKIHLEDFEDEKQLDQKREAIYTNARILEAKRDEMNQKSEHMGKVAHNFASAVAVLQIALMLLPLTLIRPNRKMQYFGVAMGAIGVLLFVASLMKFIKISGWFV